MKILFVGDYQTFEILPAPTKVGKELFAHFQKFNSEVYFYAYFQAGEKYSRYDKLFGKEKIGNGVFRLGLIPFIRNIFQLKPDIIFTITPAVYYLPILLFKKFLRFEYVYYLHSINKHVLNNFLNFPLFLKQRFLFIEKFSVLFGDKLFVLSQSESNLLRDYYKIDTERIEIVDNGIKKLNIKKNSYKIGAKLNIICVGNINRKEKSYSVLFSALGLLNNNFNVTICSESQLLDSEVKIPQNVYLNMKMLDEVELRKEISRSDLFIILSIYETFSISFLEAMNTGIPFIATDKVGLTERFNDDKLRNQIIPANDANILKQKIIDFQNMTEKQRKELGKKAIEFSENYSWDEIAVNIYRRVKKLVSKK